MLPCIEHNNGQYILKYSYVDELMVHTKMREETVARKNWKLASYINSLAKNGFKVERLVEDSKKDEDSPYTERYYSEHKAQYIHHSFVVKARKL